MFCKFRYCSLEQKSREVFISLLFLCHALYAHSILDELISQTTATAATNLFCAESSAIEQSTNYALLLNSTTYDSSGTEQNSTLQRFEYNAVLRHASKSGGVQLSLFHHPFTGEFHRPTENQGTMHVDLKQPFTTLLASAWSSPDRPIAIGVTAGKAFSSSFTADTTATLRSISPFTTASEMPLQLQGELRFNHRIFHGSCAVSRTPTTGMTPKLTMERSGNFRTFPLSSSTRTSTLSAGIHGEHKKVTAGMSTVHISPTRYTTGQNPLPIHFSAAYNETFVTGTFRAVSADCFYRQGTAALEAYDSERTISRFIRFESIPFSHLSGTLRVQIPQIDIALYGERFHAEQGENGYADFYPLSSWTLFRPYAFRFQNGQFTFQNGGVSLGKAFVWNSVQRTELALRSSYLTVAGSVDRSKKKIAVMIPIYVEDTTLSLETKRMILGDIAINHHIKIRNNALSLSARQLIPIPLENTKTDTSPSSPSEPASNQKDRIYGGLTLGISYTHPLNTIHRRNTKTEFPLL